MDDGVQIKIDFSRFNRELKAFGVDFETKAVNAAIRSATNVLKKAVIAAAPRLAAGTKWRTPGTLARAIYSKRSKRSTSGAIRYYVGIRSGRRHEKKGKNAFYWYFLEHGWMPRGRKGKLSGGNRYRALQRNRALDAGAKQVKVPFLAPAFRQSEGKATKAAESIIAKYLAKASKK